MNIFVLDNDTRLAALYHCDKHVVKMILETAQLLCTAHRELDGDERAARLSFYRATHKNHPCAKWARETRANYLWLYDLLKWLLHEYTFRYSKVHKVERDGLFLKLAEPPANIDDGASLRLLRRCLMNIVIMIP
jgi:hypothetical protein